MDTCRVCSMPLVKQNLTADGLPLEQQQKQFEESDANKALECKNCGNLCALPSKTTPEADYGKCTKCGGDNIISKPRELKDMDQTGHAQNTDSIKIWSCPVHGLRSEMPVNKEIAGITKEAVDADS